MSLNKQGKPRFKPAKRKDVTDHFVALTPQPIADGWEAECSCGWRTFVSYYDFPGREALQAEIDRRVQEHSKQEANK
jgi:hypothetical protein